MVSNTGTVYLVGAGPGDPKLITVRGKELLEEADVIVYDRLVNPQLLDDSNPDAVRIYCGKLPDKHSIPQEEINTMLVDYAKAGKNVVRLKGGDPGIFGRVGEEAAYCAEHGIDYEIIPGITSGLSAPLYAGIPVTHREVSSSVAIVTGHQKAEPSQDLNWQQLATATDTLIIYMGVKNLPYLRQKLLQYGRAASTPVALIRWGTLGNQQVLTGTLEDIDERVRQTEFQSPAIIVIGEVVRLREKLSWFQEGEPDWVEQLLMG
jgi:uroporphyrin-III C-methyltransferase